MNTNKLTPTEIGGKITGGLFRGNTLAGPEWCRLDVLDKTFGIKRGTAYNLIADGLIESVALRRAKTPQGGIRLVNVESVRRLLAGQVSVSKEAK